MTKQEQIKELEEENARLKTRLDYRDFELEVAGEAIQQRESGKGFLLKAWNKEKYQYNEYIKSLLDAYVGYLHSTGKYFRENFTIKALEGNISNLMTENKEMLRLIDFYAIKLKGVDQTK